MKTCWDVSKLLSLIDPTRIGCVGLRDDLKKKMNGERRSPF